MKRKNEPATDTLAFKLTTKENNCLKILAAAEKMTISATIRAIIMDRINFEIATGNRIFENSPTDGGNLAQQGAETKPSAARIAPPAEHLPKGAESPTRGKSDGNSSEDVKP
jgi:hypothetical protein